MRDPNEKAPLNAWPPQLITLLVFSILFLTISAFVTMSYIIISKKALAYHLKHKNDFARMNCESQSTLDTQQIDDSIEMKNIHGERPDRLDQSGSDDEEDFAVHMQSWTSRSNEKTKKVSNNKAVEVINKANLNVETKLTLLEIYHNAKKQSLT